MGEEWEILPEEGKSISRICIIMLEMPPGILEALSLKGAIPTLIYLDTHGAVFRNELREATHSWLVNQKLLPELEAAGLVKVTDMGSSKKSFFRVEITEKGKFIVANLREITHEKSIHVTFQRGYHGHLLFLLSEHEPITLREILKIEYIVEATSLLVELQRTRVVEVQEIPGVDRVDYPIRLTRRGKEIVKKLRELENLVKAEFEGTSLYEE